MLADHSLHPLLTDHSLHLLLTDHSLPPLQSITKDSSGAVTALGGELHLEGSVKTTKLKLTWLPHVCTSYFTPGYIPGFVPGLIQRDVVLLWVEFTTLKKWQWERLRDGKPILYRVHYQLLPVLFQESGHSA